MCSFAGKSSSAWKVVGHNNHEAGAASCKWCNAVLPLEVHCHPGCVVQNKTGGYEAPARQEELELELELELGDGAAKPLEAAKHKGE